MKKILVIAVAAFIGASASAQIVQSTMLNIKKEKKTTWYVRAGVSINNAAGEATKALKDEECSVGSKMGYDFSIGFQRRIGNSGLYWGEELGLGTRGAKASYSDEEGEEKNSLLAHNVKYQPLMLGFKYGITDDIKVDAHVGGFVSYDFAGTGKTEWSEDGSEDASISELDEDFGYQRLDAGVQAGIGVWYKRYNFDISYQKGFISVSDYIDNKNVYSSNLMIRLGIAF
ncbi:MAG: outer membrane beta-barrel protein [bacterium]|nr:outer membrane beta-barrel protein [bacterium]